MTPTHAGLADLARALQSLNPGKRDCPAIARLLGLRGNLDFQELANVEHVPASKLWRSGVAVEPNDEELEDLGSGLDSEDPAEAESGSSDAKGGREFSPERPHPRRSRVEHQVARPTGKEESRPTALTLLRGPAPAELPTFISEAEDIFFPDVARQLPEPEPIVSDAQLRALVSSLISVPRPGEPDIERIVAALASGKPLRSIPHRYRAGIVQHVHVVVDTADAMCLFQADAARVLRAIRRVAGGALRSETFVHGPPDEKEFPRTAEGVLLIVSTLSIGGGAVDGTQAGNGWLRVAAAWTARGLRPVAMVPFQPARWPRDLQHAFRLVPWHPPGVRARSATQEELQRLAKVLSLAAVIDPALLRAVRRSILPETDVGTEVDFARGPWVAACNPRVISLYSANVEELRSQLAADGDLLEIARRILEKQRDRPGDGWARVLFEENLVVVALKSRPDDHAPLEAILAQVIKSLLKHMHNPAAARWALSFVAELPEAARQTRAALLLRAVASMLLSTAPALVAEVVATQDAGWIFQTRIAIGVSWNGQSILIRKPQNGDVILEVPSTNPIIVMGADVNRSRQKVLRLTKESLTKGYFGWTPAPFLPRMLTTIDGAVHRLDDAVALWAKVRSSLNTQVPILGVVRSREQELYIVDIGLLARMSEASVLFGGGDPEQLEGREIQVRVIRIDDTSKDVWLGFGPLRTALREVWNRLEASFAQFRTVRGTVEYVGRTGCRVSVLGVNALLPKEQLARKDQSANDLLGRELDFQIFSFSGDQSFVYVTRRFVSADNWRKLRKAFETEAKVTGIVVAVEQEGLEVNLRGGIRAFLPATRAVFVAETETDSLIGKTYEFNIVELNDDGRKVVLDRQKVAARELTEKRIQFLETTRVGDVVTGIVKNLTDFGAFIDLFCIDGLLRTSDMTWSRLSHPSDMVKTGQEVTVIVLEIDKEKEHVYLGLKQLQSNPWDEIKERFPVGKRVKGKITSFLLNGAFVELEGGVEGLIHVSQISWTKRIVRPADVLSVGQEVEAIVLDVNKEEQKISLGLRQLDANPWDEIEKKYPPGTVVKGTIGNMTAHGAFVEIEEGINGMIHVSDMSWTRKINQPSEMLKKGDKVEAVVIDVDNQKQRLSLSIKQLEHDPWEDVDAKYKIGDLVTGKVTKLASFGAFVQLKDDFAGLLHSSQLSEGAGLKVKDVLEVGQEVKARVIKVDKAERRIGLSVKDAN